MTIDGTPTEVAWPESPPRAYRLPDGRSLIYDAYDGSLGYLWDPATRALTELGELVLEPVVGHGWLLVTLDGDARTFHDIDPDRARPSLRTVWRAEGPLRDAQLAGVVDDTAVAVVRDRWTAPPEVTLVCVLGPGAVTMARLALAPTFEPVNGDAIRGHRLLLTSGRVDYAKPSGPWDQPPTAAVAILDLDSGRVRHLGTAIGGWTIDTAIPHAYVDVRWRDPADAATPGWTVRGLPVTFVDPRSETLDQGAPGFLTPTR